jgi:hypothetical protein
VEVVHRPACTADSKELNKYLPLRFRPFLFDLFCFFFFFFFCFMACARKGQRERESTDAAMGPWEIINKRQMKDILHKKTGEILPAEAIRKQQSAL